MPHILVVDDSRVDRLLVGKLLTQKEELDWLVEYAEHGRDALEKMQIVLPDIVVTDMYMPEMDGLQLVSKIRRDYPGVVVILITGKGSEALAIEALRKGAASYVPKEKMAEELRNTIRQVLAVVETTREPQRLTDCFTKIEYNVALAGDTSLIPPLLQLVKTTLEEMSFEDETERMHVGIALEEALFNAFFYGNLELSKDQAQEARAAFGQGEVSAAVKQRLAESPYDGRKTYVKAQFTRTAVGFVIRDEGSGFDVKSLPAADDPKNVAAGRGRGLVLIRNFMDEVSFNDAGNEATMIKRRQKTRG